MSEQAIFADYFEQMAFSTWKEVEFWKLQYVFIAQ